MYEIFEVLAAIEEGVPRIDNRDDLNGRAKFVCLSNETVNKPKQILSGHRKAKVSPLVPHQWPVFRSVFLPRSFTWMECPCFQGHWKFSGDSSKGEYTKPSVRETLCQLRDYA